MALALVVALLHCTRGCSLHLGRGSNIRRTSSSLHTISPEFLSGGGDRRTTGSRSRLRLRLDKRRPHVLLSCVRTSIPPPRPRLVLSFRSREMRRRAVAGTFVWLHQLFSRRVSSSPTSPTAPVGCMHVCIAPAPLHPNQYHTLLQKTDPTSGGSFAPCEPENSYR